MTALEKSIINKPDIHLRYVDNILHLTDSTDETSTMQETSQNNFVLKFT